MADIWAVVVLSAGAATLVGQRAWMGRRRRQRLAQLNVQRLSQSLTRELAALAERTDALSLRIQTAQDALRSEFPGAWEAKVGLDLLGEFHSLLLTELRRWADTATRDLGSQRGRGLAARRRALLALQAQIRRSHNELDQRQAAWGEATDEAARAATGRRLIALKRDKVPAALVASRPRPTLAWTRG